jgi:hypothetical protein
MNPFSAAAPMSRVGPPSHPLIPAQRASDDTGVFVIDGVMACGYRGISISVTPANAGVHHRLGSLRGESGTVGDGFRLSAGMMKPECSSQRRLA